MKKIALILISAITLSCCSNKGTNETKTDRFVTVETHRLGYLSQIVYDRNTMVLYAYTHDGGFTLLVDSTGKPLTWKGDNQ